MAAVLTAAITDKVATLELDNAAGFVVGEHVHVYNVGNHFDGPHVLLTVNTTTDVITYSTGGQDVDEFTVTGGLVYAEVTWIDADDVEVWLSFAPATANEYYWLLNTRGVEVYESYKGFIRDESVGTLGVTIAVRGYFAAHVVDVNMIRVLGPDATHT